MPDMDTSNRRLDVQIVAAFTSDGAGGNPAGVVVDADGLSQSEKQAIAAEVGLSETAFVSRSHLATVKLEFFTPQRQIAHCGHATIAAFGLLGSIGRLAPGLHSKETIDGLREVRVEGASASMQQLAPRYAPVDVDAVLGALGVTSAEVDPRFAPVRVDTGNGFILVGLRRVSSLAGLRPDLAALEALSEQYDLVGFYVFADDGEGVFAATTRMFAPRYGIPEEAATGMAAGPLGCLLHDRGDPRRTLVIEQGRFMTPASPSRLEVTLVVEAGRISSVNVAGVVRRIETLSLCWRAAA
ncbi:MAG: PhzF family phenazine biosynthesis protein [Pseudomonadota bacterium]